MTNERRRPENLRFLMVIHTPWTNDLGAPQPQIGLGTELRKLGCTVEKFSYEDAFPDKRGPQLPGKLGTVASWLKANRSFAARAAAFVRVHARRFDIIDANQTDIPFTKQSLGFSGLLVARSVGLIPAYEEFEKLTARRWPERPSISRFAYFLLTYPGRRRRQRDVLASFRHADLINVSNSDDFATLSDAMGYRAKVVMFPFGLSEERRSAFCRAAKTVPERLAARTVVFIGAWNARKGAKDWPLIAGRVLRRVPDAKFLFLGTGFNEQRVKAELPAECRSVTRVVPSYAAEDLPHLLASATVGAFPSYLEGFGFAVLEKLAGGLPTVVYDAPGPRDIAQKLRFPLLVPAGDVDTFAVRVSDLLESGPDQYLQHSGDSFQAASKFTWADIANATFETYAERWKDVGRP